jgi:hypothetical protein
MQHPNSGSSAHGDERPDRPILNELAAPVAVSREPR